MGDFIWIGAAPGSRGDMLPLRHDFSSDDVAAEPFLRMARQMIKEGEPLARDFFPTAIWGSSNNSCEQYDFPDLFYANGFWVVSNAAADVLQQFNLGGGGLYPTKLLKRDKTSTVEGEWFCFNVGNKKDALVASESTSLRERYIREGQKGWFPKTTIKDGDIVVLRTVDVGADVWIDRNVGGAFFLSEPLGLALQRARADTGFFLNKCRVV